LAGAGCRPSLPRHYYYCFVVFIRATKPFLSQPLEACRVSDTQWPLKPELNLVNRCTKASRIISKRFEAPRAPALTYLLVASAPLSTPWSSPDPAAPLGVLVRLMVASRRRHKYLMSVPFNSPKWYSFLRNLATSTLVGSRISDRSIITTLYSQSTVQTYPVIHRANSVYEHHANLHNSRCGDYPLLHPHKWPSSLKFTPYQARHKDQPMLEYS
jgi:hypothetical protein